MQKMAANSEKFENLLNLALDATAREREKSLQLGVGYEPEEQKWELIVKYSGNIMRLAEENPRIEVIELMNEYAVLYVPEDAMEQVAMAPEVEYVEKPKRMYFAVQEGKQASCITPVQSARYNLTGKGVIVAVLDSGEPVTVLSRHCCFSFFSGVGTADILSACETAG
jgi:minor extracellular serine protease Vpr